MNSFDAWWNTLTRQEQLIGDRAYLAEAWEDGRASVADSIHYPEGWDIKAYPTLESALAELYAWFKCTNTDCSHKSHKSAVTITEGV